MTSDCGRNRVFDIATRYWLDDSGIEFRWRRNLFVSVQTGPAPTPSLQNNWYWVSIPTVKRLGCGAEHPPRLTPRLKKEYSYTSTPPMGIHGLLLSEFYRTFTELTYQQRRGGRDGSNRYGLLIRNNKLKKNLSVRMKTGRRKLSRYT